MSDRRGIRCAEPVTTRPHGETFGLVTGVLKQGMRGGSQQGRARGSASRPKGRNALASHVRFSYWLSRRDPLASHGLRVIRALLFKLLRSPSLPFPLQHTPVLTPGRNATLPCSRHPERLIWDSPPARLRACSRDSDRSSPATCYTQRPFGHRHRVLLTITSAAFGFA